MLILVGQMPLCGQAGYKVGRFTAALFSGGFISVRGTNSIKTEYKGYTHDAQNNDHISLI
jgi:hypothetical protein